MLSETELVVSYMIKQKKKIDDHDFINRSDKDRHQFRIILSPEDGDKLQSFKSQHTKLHGANGT